MVRRDQGERGGMKNSRLFSRPPTLHVVFLRDSLNHPAEGAAPPLHSAAVIRGYQEYG